MVCLDLKWNHSDQKQTTFSGGYSRGVVKAQDLKFYMNKVVIRSGISL